MIVRILGVAACLLTSPAALGAQQTHEIRLVQGGRQGYSFEPSRVNVRPGDVVQFVVTSGGPYVVGFEPEGLSDRDRLLLDQALPEHTGPLRGPVLRGAGARFRIIVPDLPKGQYRFLSVTHISYRMAGVLILR
ncbi:MAG TPA: hypothetical protein VMG41_08240 [Gemmatimonadales bacterium]|nr:hypothetical protein [Gemmatimonadales bacterium]